MSFNASVARFRSCWKPIRSVMISSERQGGKEAHAQFTIDALPLARHKLLKFMSNRWRVVVNALLAGFTLFVISWQFRGKELQSNPDASLIRSCFRGELLANIPDIVKREDQNYLASGRGRYLDLLLPEDARVFMTDMTGPTNYDKIGFYMYLTYYLFPREIGVSIDQPTRLTHDGFLGRTSKSNQEILDHRYDVRIDQTPHDPQVPTELHHLHSGIP